MSGTKRAFIAVNLPGETKKRIAEELLSLFPRKGMKTVGRENLHITMRFLGYLSGDAIKEIAEKMQFAGEVEDFEVELSGTGHFKKRVIWLGVGRGSGELIGLSRGISEAIECREERFHPHVTLARNKWLKSFEIKELLEKLNERDFSETVKAESLDLMESVLSQKGPKYSLLEKISFK